MLFSKLCCVQWYRWRLLFVTRVGEDTRFALSYAVIVNTVMMLTKANWISAYLHLIATHFWAWGFIMGSLKAQKTWGELTVTVIKTLPFYLVLWVRALCSENWFQRGTKLCLPFPSQLCGDIGWGHSTVLISVPYWRIHGGFVSNENSPLLRSFQAVKSSFQRKNWKKLEAVWWGAILHRKQGFWPSF